MDWQKDENYLRFRARLERCHEIAADLGMTDEATNAWELVLLEMQYSANYDLAVIVADLVYRWKKEKNTYYLDKAMCICSTSGAVPSPALFKELSEAAARRYTIGHEGLPASSEKIEKDAVKGRAFILMMNLIYHGETLELAASKAARWVNDNIQAKPMKASTLETYYVRDIRRKGIESRYFESWGRWLDDDTRRQWELLRGFLPTADDDLKGVRRR